MVLGSAMEDAMVDPMVQEYASVDIPSMDQTTKKNYVHGIGHGNPWHFIISNDTIERPMSSMIYAMDDTLECPIAKNSRICFPWGS